MTENDFILYILKLLRKHQKRIRKLEDVGFDLDKLHIDLDGVEDLILDYLGLPYDNSCDFEDYEDYIKQSDWFCRDYWHHLLTDMPLNKKSFVRFRKEVEEIAEEYKVPEERGENG